MLVKVNPEGKYVVDIDKDIDVNKCTANTRVALRNDSYVLHKILPTKVRGAMLSCLFRVCCSYFTLCFFLFFPVYSILFLNRGTGKV